MPINLRIGHGCHCNRPTLDGIRNAGFEVTELGRDVLSHAPPWIRPLIAGVAQPSSPSSDVAVDQVVYSSTISSRPSVPTESTYGATAPSCAA